MHKRLLILLMVSLISLTLQAQELTVKSMQAMTMDLSASQYERKDLAGQTCGLVKVQLAAVGAQFEGNVILVKKTDESFTHDEKSINIISSFPLI